MRIWALIATFAATTIAATAAVVVAAPAAGERFALAQWAQAGVELAAAVACLAAAGHTRGRARLVWALFAAGEAIWAITDATFGGLLVAGVAVPEISPLDASWLAYYGPIGLASLLLYWRLRPERGWQGVIDGLIATIALAALGWITVIGDLAETGSGGILGTLVVTLYPTLDLICLTALGWIVLRHGRRTPLWLRWVVAAFAAQGVAGVGYLISALGNVGGEVLSAGAYMAAGWCWIAAGLARCRAHERAWAAGTHDRPPGWSETIPFVLGMGVVGLGAVRPDAELRGAAVLVAGLMAMRAIEALKVGRGLLTERDRVLITDPLTGAFNRRFLGEEITRAFSRATRGGEALSAIALDLDHFKEVNDRFGHGVGDELLQAATAAIASQLRASDVLCRLGGDEFLVLCNATDTDGALILAERLRECILAAAARVVPEVAVSSSLGVATFPTHATTPSALLQCADEALYAAKGRGRNAVACFDAGGTEVLEHHA